MCNTRYSCQILMKFEFSWQIFEKYSVIKLHENLMGAELFHVDGRTDKLTDITKLIVTFLQFCDRV